MIEGDFFFNAEWHDAGEKLLLGREFKVGEGMEEGHEVLAMLAKHPSTARHVARKLAVRFVSDDPLGLHTDTELDADADDTRSGRASRQTGTPMTLAQVVGLILGSGILGGKVHGSIPPLRREELEDGRDLPVTIDFRSIFAEVAGQHLNIDDDSSTDATIQRLR